MKRHNRSLLALLIAGVVFSSGVQAKASAADAAKLGMTGTPLTPVGAERAGNADGSIPAWDGGVTAPPSGSKIGMHHPDPFPNEKPKFEITAKNYKDYASQLGAGQVA